MTKFDLKAAKAAASNNQQAEPISAGYHRVVITQVAEVGLQPGYNVGDDPKESIALVFQNSLGQCITKTITLTQGVQSNLLKLLSAIDEVDEFSDLLGQQLVLEIEANGKWPRITQYFHLDEGLCDVPAISQLGEMLFYSVDEPNPDVLKKLHADLKGAIARRIRHKAGV